MIASVVATLEASACPVTDIIDEISTLSGVEIGEFDSAARRIPITIDSPAANAIEDTTRRLQECHGVAFVDVVFVHLEDETEQTVAASPEGTNRS
jgi:nitrate reductase NapAB chaperone NapD